MSYHHSSRSPTGLGLVIGGRELRSLQELKVPTGKKGFWDFFKEGLAPAPAPAPGPGAPAPRVATGMPGWVVPAAIGAGGLVLFLVLRR